MPKVVPPDLEISKTPIHMSGTACSLGAKLKVSTRALAQRINRVLPTDKKLVFDRRSDKYVIITLDGKLQVMHFPSLSQLAIDLGVLKPYEELES